jgi:hypothetical protein
MGDGVGNDVGNGDDCGNNADNNAGKGDGGDAGGEGGGLLAEDAAAAAAAVAAAMVVAAAAYCRGRWLLIVKKFLRGIFMMCEGNWPGHTSSHTLVMLEVKLIGSWGTRLLAMAGEVTRHGRAHPYSWLITIVSLRSKESEECHKK